MEPPNFSLEGVQKVSHLGWKGMFMISVDLKNVYFHCGLHKSSWTYFGFAWEEILYIYIILCFGWSPTAFIYANFTELIAEYMRELASAMLLTWIDDSLASSSKETLNKS